MTPLSANPQLKANREISTFVDEKLTELWLQCGREVIISASSSFTFSCSLSAGLSGVEVLLPCAPCCTAGMEKGAIDEHHISNLCLSRRNHLHVIKTSIPCYMTWRENLMDDLAFAWRNPRVLRPIPCRVWYSGCRCMLRD